MFLYSFCFLRAISKYKPQEAYICRGDLREGFLRYEFGGLIFGGAYFRNFTVLRMSLSLKVQDTSRISYRVLNLVFSRGMGREGAYLKGVLIPNFKP